MLFKDRFHSIQGALQTQESRETKYPPQSAATVADSVCYVSIPNRQVSALSLFFCLNYLWESNTQMISV